MDAHASPLLSLYLSELLFGVLYAILVHWLSVKKIMEGSTALSVVIGDGATLFIQWLFIRSNWDPFVTFLCFAFSGTPMFTTYVYRYERQKRSHKPRRLPNRAMRIRDEAMMDLMMMAVDIAEGKEKPESLVHRLHTIMETLRSM